MLKKVDHIGIAVHDIDKILKIFGDAFELKVDSVDIQKDYGVKVMRMKVGDISLEFYQPLTSDSVTAQFLRKHGEGIHHICFKTRDLQKTMNTLKSKGLRIYRTLDEEESLQKNVVFIDPYTTHRILIELMGETDDEEM